MVNSKKVLKKNIKMGNIKFRKFKLDKIKLSFYHKSEVKISKGGSRIDTNKISDRFLFDLIGIAPNFDTIAIGSINVLIEDYKYKDCSTETITIKSCDIELEDICDACIEEVPNFNFDEYIVKGIASIPKPPTKKNNNGWNDVLINPIPPIVTEDLFSERVFVYVKRLSKANCTWTNHISIAKVQKNIDNFNNDDGIDEEWIYHNWFVESLSSSGEKEYINEYPISKYVVTHWKHIVLANN